MSLADLRPDMTDEERAKALGMSLDDFLNYSNGVLNAYRTGNQVVVGTLKPVVVNVDKKTGQVVEIKRT